MDNGYYGPSELPSCPGLEKFTEKAELIGQNLELASRLTGDAIEISRIFGEVRMQIAAMDHALNLFIADKQYNLAKFREAVPMVERQLDRISSRMDEITMRVLDANLGSDSASRDRLSQLIDMLNTQSESFNTMIIKLLSI